MRGEDSALSLVSVVGLIGFGLLGAAASTIIRERGTDINGTPKPEA